MLADVYYPSISQKGDLELKIAKLFETAIKRRF